MIKVLFYQTSKINGKFRWSLMNLNQIILIEWITLLYNLKYRYIYILLIEIIEYVKSWMYKYNLTIKNYMDN